MYSLLSCQLGCLKNQLSGLHHEELFNVFLKNVFQMLTVHYYMMFDGPEKTWPHMKTFYRENSALT